MTTTEFLPLDALKTLGFSEIESLVYLYLLQHDSSTGYRVSHEIGKPTANTYKAIASLEQRGAVQVDEGDNRQVKAIPPEELLAQMDRRFREQREAASAALAELKRDVADDRVYALKSATQVLERARAMLARSRQIVLGDIFPRVLDVLADDLARAAARGVRVAVKAYAPAEIKGVEILRQPDVVGVLEIWPGQQLSLVVDAEEHLLALFDDGLGSVHQAVWSRSTFLSCLHYNHLAMEHLVTLYSDRRQESLEAADAALQDHVNTSVLHARTLGLDRLQARYGTVSPAKESSS